MPIAVKKIYKLCEIGGRKNNEDAVFPREPLPDAENRLYVVCDGVGGNACGEFASAIVSETFHTHLCREPFDDIPDEAAVNGALIAAIEALRIHERRHPETEGMACTLTFAYIGTRQVLLGWCGDSRIHHLRNGEILYQTNDHSMVGEMLRNGLITAEETKTNPNRNIILRSVNAEGRSSEIEFHRLTDIEEGDFVLLCTDGLLENIDDAALRTLFRDSGNEDLTVAFNRYCYGKTKDNYSMYLLGLGMRAAGVKQDTSHKKIPSPQKKNRLIYFLLALVLLLSAVCAYMIWGGDHANTIPSATPSTAPAKSKPLDMQTPSTSHNNKPASDSVHEDRSKELDEAVERAVKDKLQKHGQPEGKDPAHANTHSEEKTIDKPTPVGEDNSEPEQAPVKDSGS